MFPISRRYTLALVLPTQHDNGFIHPFFDSHFSPKFKDADVLLAVLLNERTINESIALTLYFKLLRFD